MSVSQLATTASGKNKLIVAQDSAALAVHVAIAQAETVVTYPSIDNPSDGNKFVTVYPNNPSKLK